MFISIVVCVLSAGLIFAGEIETEYLAVLMDGKKIGYSDHVRQVKDGKVTTSENMVMTIGRGGVSLTISIKQTSIESLDGKPLGFAVVQNISGMAQTTTGTIDNSGIMSIRTMGMGQQRNEKKPYPKGALMSEGVRLLQVNKGLKAGDKLSTKKFDPTTQSAMKIDLEVGDKAKVDLFGRVVELTEVKSTMHTTGGPMVATSYVDKDLSALKTVMSVMGMNLELIACDKQFAMSPNDVVDFISNMLVQSPVEIKDVRSRESIEYVLVAKNDSKIKVPTSDNQAVKVGDDGKVTVTVKPVAIKAGEKFPYKGKDEKLLEMLKPTRHLQSDDKLVKELAKKAVAGARDSAQAARNIEVFVGQYIDAKNLSVGYASAAEVALSKQGDCSEHAVLTAAMCRAAGIPSRIATGVIYADVIMGKPNAFGGHAWTEAYINGKWVGLDATRAPNGYGVGHITLATGSGEPEDFLGMVNTLGNFKIESVK